MGFLGNIATQFTDTNSLLSPAKRWLAIALPIVAVASLIMVWQTPTQPYTELFSGREFTSAELVQIEQAFAIAGLTDWQIDASQVSVPREQKSSYLSSLQGVIEADTLNADIDLALKNSSLWEPRHVKDLKIKHAEEKQLSRMLATMKYIENVTVRKDEIQLKGLRGRRETTALAAVKPTGNLQLDSHKAYAIRNAVAACYAGLASDQVTVLDLNSGRVFGGDPQEPTNREDPYTLRKRHFEQLYQDRVRSELAVEIPDVSVKIYVALNYVEEPIANASPLDPEAQQPGITDPLASVLAPQHIVASITLPADYQQQQTEGASEHPMTPQTLKSRVVQILQVPTSSRLPAPSAVVHIQTSSESIAVANLAAEDRDLLAQVTESPWMWLGWIMFAIIGASLVIQQAYRKNSVVNLPQSEPLPEPLEASDSPPNPVVETAIPSTTEPEDPSADQLRFQLTDRVRQSPDSAVHVLKHWLDDAA